MSDDRPNVLFLMTDQQRFDTIGSMVDGPLETPNLDRLTDSGVTFTNAYSQCPVCVPARYNIRTGREPPTTQYYGNDGPGPADGSVADIAGQYLAASMSDRGYHTFGVGKFHTHPRFEELGYDVQLYSEELYNTRENKEQGDDYGRFLKEEHSEFDFIEQPHGERTEMYYMPQMSPLPADVTVEQWAADRAVEQLSTQDGDPFFGMVSFVGPHPPLAPPIPFNRLYDPDDVPEPVRGDREVDHMDEQIPWMNHLIWATDEGDTVDDLRARVIRARYFGEISYIDQCIGQILDELEATGQRENTLICFFSDHGDMLGDHHGWQKNAFFEEACRIPFVVSWPAELPGGERHDGLVSLTDLFGIATTAAGDQELRDGIDVLGMLQGEASARDTLLGYSGEPGTRDFTVMVREGPWKYVSIANGGREQLFHLGEDPNELENRAADEPEVVQRLEDVAMSELSRHGATEAIENGSLREFEFQRRERNRIRQLPSWKGVDDYPDDPAAFLESYTRP